MRIRTLSLWRQIIFLPRHGARYMYWQQSGPFCLRKPDLEVCLSLWIIWFLYWWDFSQHGFKNGILHGWQEKIVFSLALSQISSSTTSAASLFSALTEIYIFNFGSVHAQQLHNRASSSIKWSIRTVLEIDARRTIPWTSYPFSRRNSAR